MYLYRQPSWLLLLFKFQLETMFSPIFWKPPVLTARRLEVLDAAADDLEDLGGAAVTTFWTRVFLSANQVVVSSTGLFERQEAYEKSWLEPLLLFLLTCFACSVLGAMRDQLGSAFLMYSVASSQARPPVNCPFVIMSKPRSCCSLTREYDILRSAISAARCCSAKLSSLVDCSIS